MNKVSKYQLNETVDLNLHPVTKDFISESATPIVVYDYEYTGDVTNHDFFNIGNYLKEVIHKVCSHAYTYPKLI